MPIQGGKRSTKGYSLSSLFLNLRELNKGYIERVEKDQEDMKIKRGIIEKKGFALFRLTRKKLSIWARAGNKGK